jgi:hypothetical protein
MPNGIIIKNFNYNIKNTNANYGNDCQWQNIWEVSLKKVFGKDILD